MLNSKDQTQISYSFMKILAFLSVKYFGNKMANCRCVSDLDVICAIACSQIVLFSMEHFVHMPHILRIMLKAIHKETENGLTKCILHGSHVSEQECFPHSTW